MKPASILGIRGRSSSGKVVNGRTAMQTTAVCSCVRILSEAIASLPVHLYRYAGKGKERAYLHYLLHDEPKDTSYKGLKYREWFLPV